MDGRRYKRQRMKAQTAFTTDNVSWGTESSEEVTTLSAIITVEALKSDLLERERLHSGPTGTWLEEVGWASKMRNVDQVMNSAQARRLFNVYGVDDTVTPSGFDNQQG